MISGTAPPWVGCVEFIAEDGVGWRRAGPEAAEGAKLNRCSEPCCVAEDCRS